MGRSYCPKCDKNIFQELYDEFIEDIDFGKYFKFECPYCGTKLIISIDWDFIIEKDE